MQFKKLSLTIAALILGSFCVNAVMMACGQVRSAPDAGATTEAGSAGAVFPPGMIMAYAGSAPPDGWLLCDGSVISRTMYGPLFAAIGDAWGRGDGVTTFNLPDLRGRFLRGTDSGALRDPDRAARAAVNVGGNTGDKVGSVQDDALQGHQHSSAQLFDVISSPPSPIDGLGVPRLGKSDQASELFPLTTSAVLGDGTHGTPRLSNETRPQNVNVTYVIKE